MNIQTISSHPVEFIHFFLTADIGFIVCKHLESEREKQSQLTNVKIIVIMGNCVYKVNEHFMKYQDIRVKFKMEKKTRILW